MPLREVEIFRLRYLAAVSLGMIVFYMYLIVRAWPNFNEVAPYAVCVLAFASILLLGNIKVHAEGIQMYYFNRLAWHDIQSAEDRVIFGQPYMYITRERGPNWWLPLYFKGSRSIRSALREKAPVENPIGRVCADNAHM